MDITKRDSKMLKGVAILSMLMLHLFCRRENLPYTPLLWIGGTPLIYYFALFGDICVAIYCFVSGYAHYMQSSEAEIKKRWKHLLHFFIPFWVIAAVFSLIGLLAGNAEIPGSLMKFALNCLTIQNSYNGAWWYANTYILLVALQPLSRSFAERCPAWLVMLLTFGFYTVGYGIRFWGWGACDSMVLSWIIMHIGLLGTSYSPYDRDAVLQKADHFSAAAADRRCWEKGHANRHTNYLRMYDCRTRHRAAAFCGVYHSYRNDRTALHLSNSKVDN